MEKLEIQAKITAKSKGELIHEAHQGLSIISPQQISRETDLNATNEKSPKIHPKIDKKKNARD